MKGRLQRAMVPLLFVGACSFPEYAFKGTAASDASTDARTTTTCSDGVQGPNETGVDCGGVCPVCSAGQGCGTNADCDSANCEDSVCRAATCMDGIANGAESDVDCGGRCLKLCAAGARCNSGADCESGNCSVGRCVSPSCTDGVSNGDE
ncbi:MAG TPA: hypothetical protein VNW92_03200, partial [Polyangiaceae bacterium]|nr:hypothetical protein [Polyangiaceae bacterium]